MEGFFAFFSVELGAQTPVAPTISGYYAGVNGGYNMPLSKEKVEFFGHKVSAIANNNDEGTDLNPEYVKFSFGEGVNIGFTRGI